MRFLLRTYGCRANQYDSEAVRAMLLSAGAGEVDDAEDADIAIFNSCSVTAAAEAELRKGVRRAARSNPSLRTVVMGCAPGLSIRDERIAPLRTLPTVSDTVAGANLNMIAATLGLRNAPSPSGARTQTGARALLRIQDGCDEHCTFCATTLARGSNRSRSLHELVAEAQLLAESHPEIVLTGIHIGSYGTDTGSSLSLLVEALIKAIPLVRFRLSSLEATEVDDRLLELLADPARLAPYLHAPLQSGSDRVLRRMGRHWYTARTYEARIERIVGSRRVFGLGADVICGFPGEAEEDHHQTRALIERLPFTSLHVFPYSARPGAAASRLRGEVASTDIDRRCSELRELSRHKSADYRNLRADGTADVVAISAQDGLTEDHLSVAIASPGIRRRDRFAAKLFVRNATLTATTTGSLEA
ncbi:MAG TPA: MiaB/RimO family radical SAM methylthiotransferase [Gemmatimonadaceae bacterium]|nr:MiaB/RimO family radical SAM methylthiotransferase [Gemmatimonadaceae bacterium]